MGLAVIPTIFSIAEDAVYVVPTHLVRGSPGTWRHRMADLGQGCVVNCQPGIFLREIMTGMWAALSAKPRSC